MKYSILRKGTMVGLLLTLAGLNANAQKIEEQELKVNIGKITNSTQQLIDLEPVTFKYDVKKYNHLKLPSGEQYGFLASNVQPKLPTLVYSTSKVYNVGKNNSKVATYDEVQTEHLIPLLVGAIKEQQAEIELLKKELNLLKQQTE